VLRRNHQTKHKHFDKHQSRLKKPLPSKQQAGIPVNRLNDATQACFAALELNGYISKVQVIGKDMTLTNTLATPDHTPNYHSLNVS
jgi:hypothetical protein